MMPANSTDQGDARQVESESGRMTDATTEVLDVGDVAEIFQCSREKIKRMARRENRRHSSSASIGTYAKMILSASSPAE